MGLSYYSVGKSGAATDRRYREKDTVIGQSNAIPVYQL